MSNYPNWFEMTARRNFVWFLSNKRGLQSYKCLQIGAYVGHASEWLAQNVLTGKGAMLHDVDTWKGSDEIAHEQMDWEDVEARYMHRIAPYLFTRIKPYQMTSDAFFALYNDGLRYDFVYIDGDHTAAQVYRDAVNGWRVLRAGGIMAFDDYTWGEGLPAQLRPKPAIDRFLSETQGHFKLLEIRAQVWLRKL